MSEGLLFERPNNLAIASRVDFPWGSIAVSQGVEDAYGIIPREGAPERPGRSDLGDAFAPIDVTLAADHEYDVQLPPGSFLVNLADVQGARRWPVDVIFGEAPVRSPLEEDTTFRTGQIALALQLQQTLPGLVEERALDLAVDGSRKSLLVILGATLGVLTLDTLSNHGEVSTSGLFIAGLGLVGGMIFGHRYLKKAVTGLHYGQSHRRSSSISLAALIASDLRSSFQLRPYPNPGDIREV